MTDENEMHFSAHFKGASQFSGPVLFLERSVKNPELKGAAAAFEANITNVGLMSALYPFAFHAGRCQEKASQSLEGYFGLDKIEYLDRQVSEQIELSNEWDIACASDALGQAMLLVGRDADDGMNAVYFAVLTLVWMAFECLAGDVWEAAAQALPQRLIRNMSISLKDVEVLTRGKFDIDLRTSVGYLARRQMHFDSLKKILDNYKGTFKDERDHGKILAILNCVEVEMLATIRNLIVHTAGKCDARYLDVCTRIQRLPVLKLNENLRISGQQVRDFTLPVIVAGRNLVLEIDKWISENR